MVLSISVVSMLFSALNEGHCHATQNKLCILIFMFMYSYSLYALCCIFCFHHANCQAPTTLTEVFPCFFLSCNAVARVAQSV
jgi:hypothetical protein